MTEIRTLRAPNPSALTGTGTNTYLLGRGDVAVIDPGPASEAHLAAILDSLAAGERITHILVTHPHLDHSALVPRLSAATGAPVLAFGGATAGRSPLMSSLAAAGMAGGGEGLDHSFAPDRHLADGETVAGASWSVTALHTPGHLGAHLCFAAEDILFSGDHVMGWSTSIVSPPDGDMTDYMNSLRSLASQAWLRLLPGHGEPVETPAERLRALIDHRLQREAQILDALTLGPADATTLTQRVYTDIAPALLPAARRNVLAHLIDLTSKGSVSTLDLLRHDTAFHLS